VVVLVLMAAGAVIGGLLVTFRIKEMWAFVGVMLVACCAVLAPTAALSPSTSWGYFVVPFLVAICIVDEFARQRPRLFAPKGRHGARGGTS